jgi:hypothetical protein
MYNYRRFGYLRYNLYRNNTNFKTMPPKNFLIIDK